MNSKRLAKAAGVAAIGISAGILIAALKKVKVPKGIVVVQPFFLEKYIGTWYEIARFDFRFERDMKNVTAHYSLNEEGAVIVRNKGYNYVKNEWKEAEGIAKFIGNSDKAALKVSFMAPFYGGYNVVAIEDDYNYALVFGESKKYIWMLSREKTMPFTVKEKFLNIARSAGYDLNKLVWTQQDA